MRRCRGRCRRLSERELRDRGHGISMAAVSSSGKRAEGLFATVKAACEGSRPEAEVRHILALSEGRPPMIQLRDRA